MKRARRYTAAASIATGLALVIALTAFASRYAFDDSSEPVDYTEKMNELARSLQPEVDTQPNRFDFVADLAEDAGSARERIENEHGHVVPEVFASPDEAHWDAIYQGVRGYDYGTHLARAQRHIDALEEAGVLDRLELLPDIRHAYEPIPEGLTLYKSTSPDRFLPLTGRLQELANTLIHYAVHKARNGRPGRAIDLFEQALSVARIISYKPLMINALAAQSIPSTAIPAITNALIEHRFTNEQLDRLQRVADAQRPVSWQSVLDAQRLVWDDRLQHVSPPSKAKNRINAIEGVIRDALEDPQKPIPDAIAIDTHSGGVLQKIPGLTGSIENAGRIAEMHRLRLAHEHAFTITLVLERLYFDRGA